MKLKDKSEKVADYAWLAKGRKYWNIWQGNPFCVSLYKVGLHCDKEDLISEIKRMQRVEKERYAKEFPCIKWIG
jgi:hypothetical protein